MCVCVCVSFGVRNFYDFFPSFSRSRRLWVVLVCASGGDGGGGGRLQSNKVSYFCNILFFQNLSRWMWTGPIIMKMMDDW